MKKMVAIILTFLISTLILIGCLSPKDDYNPPLEPNNPKYTELAFEVDGEFTTFVHLHIPYPDGPREVHIPKVFVHTKDMIYYEEVESLDSFAVTGNDDVAIGLISRTIIAKNDYISKIDNLVTLSVTFSINNEERILQIRVTKGDYEN